MQTQVKIKELLKLLDPTTDGVVYDTTHIHVDFDLLKEYVLHPRTKKVFEYSDDPTLRFYKNAALYIINSEEPKVIQLNLDKEYIIENGLFEYICANYKRQEEVVIDVPETGNNLLFIQSKNLQHDASLSLPTASDIEYTRLQSIFNKPILVQEKTAPVNNQQFTWNADGPDLFSNEEWVKGQLKNITSKTFKDDTALVELNNFIKKANNEYVKSDEFKLLLLDMENNQFIEQLFSDKQRTLQFDFTQEVFEKKLFELIEKRSFTVLMHLFERESKRPYGQDSEDHVQTPRISFSKFINHPHVIEHLKESNRGKDGFSFNKSFNIKDCYYLFNGSNQVREDIVDAYLEFITKVHATDRSPYMSEQDVMKLAPDAFNNREVMNKVIKFINPEELKNKIKYCTTPHTIITDPEFLIDNANNIYPHHLIKILVYLYEPTNINKELMIPLVRGNRKLLEQLQNPNNYKHYLSHDMNEFVNLAQDIDVMIAAYQGGTTLNNISTQLIKPHLLTQGTPEQEKFKIAFVIYNKLNGWDGKKLYKEEAEQQQFIDKFAKPQYHFFKVDTWSFTSSEAIFSVMKMNKQEVQELWNEIQSLRINLINHPIDYLKFYKALPSQIKNDWEFLQSNSILNHLKYEELSETLQYNQKVILHYAKTQEIKNVPLEFFNDINFALDFAKLMDNGLRSKNSIPVFVLKFFDNQEVHKDYHHYLESYIHMYSLKDEFAQKDKIKEEAGIELKAVKKRKI